MKKSDQFNSLKEMPVDEKTTIQTSLYDLVEAISEETNPNEEDLIGLTLLHIFSSDEFKVRCNPESFHYFSSGSPEILH